jgi:hypothetical protein
MMTPTEKITARLYIHRDALLKLGDEFGEIGNQYVISAGTWLHPVITDFIQLVQERYDSIAHYAQSKHTISPEIVRAADDFFDEAVELILRIYPLAVRSKVRGITSQIRNELAILRIDTKSMLLEPEVITADEADYARQTATWKSKINAINNDPQRFKEFLETEKSLRSSACHIILQSVELQTNTKTTPTSFYKLAIQASNSGQRTPRKKTLRHGEVPAHNNAGQKSEKYFAAFKRYWSSLPAGNLLLAMAIHKMVEDQSLLEQIIRYRADVKTLLIDCLPTVELRHRAVLAILNADYLDSRCISRLFDFLPEGKKVNGRVDAALFGVKKYLSQPHGENALHIEWDTSKQKIRAETFLHLLDYYANAKPFVKKVVIYTLLLSDGKKLQQQVYRIMGYAQLETAKKNLRESIHFDAELMKINFNQISEEVIQPIIQNTNAKKSFESGAYTKAMNKLVELTPSSQEMS